MSRRIAHSRARASHDERLTPENQAQNKTDPKCGHDRLHRIFAHIILAVFSKRAQSLFRFVQLLAGLISIILLQLRHRRFHIFRRQSRRDQTQKNSLRRFFSELAPGLVTGAADDDPSGIATYTIAGAQLGTSLLWTAVLTWPLMGCVQFPCARIGMVTGEGLGAALRKKIPRWMLILTAFALFGANSVNIGADLFGMADAAEMLSGLNSHLLILIFVIRIVFWSV